jgi:ElaB/YqjD/DUF883 family membrane-anchored ribosome-binding protein
MAERPDVIRNQIEETRESLTGKLETLEGHVKEAVGTVTDTIETVKSSVETVKSSVETVKSGVENTVESVKTSLHDTVDSVKETLDLSGQVQRHPWGAVGCSLMAGVAAGYLLSGPRRRQSNYWDGIPGMNQLIPGYQPSRPAEAPRQEFREEPDFLSKLLSSFGGELDKVKEMAIGALLGIARDALKDALPPSLGANVAEIMDNVTRRAGGEPVRGQVLETEHAGAGNGARGGPVG